MAIDAGAGALGFNFYRPSPRYIQPQAARAIIEQLPSEILTVGVFVNESSETLEQIASEAKVTALQLHGDESPEFCDLFKDRYVIKVLAVKHDFDPQSAHAYDVQAIMVDAFDKSRRGGTGETIDWSIARQTRELVPRLFLAGGLSAENVGAAITAVEPFAVDACSALETVPGRKDPQRVREFVKAALGPRG